MLSPHVLSHTHAHTHTLSAFPCCFQTAKPCRFADPLAAAHEGEQLGKFEELLEAAIDMARVPDEYVIAPTYDQVRCGVFILGRL
jgi:hypothetical protein